jgi:hypothetical protein
MHAIPQVSVVELDQLDFITDRIIGNLSRWSGEAIGRLYLGSCRAAGQR